MSEKIMPSRERTREETPRTQGEPLAMALQAHALAQALLAYYAGSRSWPTPTIQGGAFETPPAFAAPSYFAPSPYYGSSQFYGSGPTYSPPGACAGSAGSCGHMGAQAGAGVPSQWMPPQWMAPQSASPQWMSPWSTPYGPPAERFTAWTPPYPGFWRF